MYTCLVLCFAYLLFQPFANKTGISLVDALFVSASAMSVTGLTPIDVSQDLTTLGQVILLIQFQIGGIGIMAIFTYILIFIGREFSISQLLVMSADQNQKSISSIQKIMFYVVVITLSVEFVGVLCTYPTISKIYEPGWNSLFMSVFHTVSAFTNAGFDLFGDSLIGFQKQTFFLVSSMFLMLVGVLGFPLILDLFNFKRKKKTLFTKVNLFTHAILLIVGFILFLFSEWDQAFVGLNIKDKIANAFFLSMTSRNAGLSSIDVGFVQNGTLLVLLFLMFIGASSSSCGGGVRTSTIAVIVSKIWSIARGKEDASLFRKTIPNDTVNKSFLVFFVFLLFYLISLVVISLIEPFSLRDLSFEVLSALTTTGLSTGITSELSVFSKLLLSLLMLIGRVGIIAWIYLFIKEKNTKTKFIKEDIIVG